MKACLIILAAYCAVALIPGGQAQTPNALQKAYGTNGANCLQQTFGITLSVCLTAINGCIAALGPILNLKLKLIILIAVIINIVTC